MFTNVKGEAEADKKIAAEQNLIFVWSCAVFFSTMNSTMFNIAIPSVQSDLSISISLASWIISGYSIVLAISTLTFSRLSESIPALKLIITGILLLGAGSFIGYFSDHYIFTLITRLIQAAGAGSIVSLAVVVAARYIPSARRGRALALISSSAVSGLGLGPVIGGVIDQYVGWNALFLVTASVLLFIPFFILLVPREQQRPMKFDALGCMLTILSAVCLMLFFTTFHVLYIVPVFILGIFTRKHFLQVKHPFINTNLLKKKRYTHLLYVSFIGYFVYFAALFILPLLLSDLFQSGSLEIGLLLLPGAIGSALAANTIGKIIEKLGNGNVIVMSQLLFLISIIMFIFLSAVSPVFMLLAYLFMSPGFTALSTSIRNEIASILQPNEVATGVGIAQLTQFFGGAFGVTVSGTILAIEAGLSSEFMYMTVYIMLGVLTCISAFIFKKYNRSGSDKCLVEKLE
ncbi:MFS transporter [Virgibacillus kimchii]